MSPQMQKKMVRLQKLFPNVWMKDGALFDKSQAGAIWTGEGSDIDGISAFDRYGPFALYDMGIHKDFVEELQSMGLWAEWYDGGTLFIYQL